MMKAYEKLAKFYNKDWGKFSSLYMRLVEYTIDKYKLETNKVLDVACGTGMLAGDLVNMGFEVLEKFSDFKFTPVDKRHIKLFL